MIVNTIPSLLRKRRVRRLRRRIPQKSMSLRKPSSAVISRQSSSKKLLHKKKRHLRKKRLYVPHRPKVRHAYVATPSSKNIDVTYSGDLVVTTFLKPSGPTTVDHITTYPKGRYLFLMSPIVRGNRKAPNSHSFQRVIQTGGLYNYSWSNSGSNVTYVGNIFVAPPGLPFDKPAMMDSVFAEANAKVLDKIRGKTDISIDLAEIGKTIATPKQIATIVKEFGKISKKIGFRRLTSPMKLIGGIHLMFTYGIKPTMQTIYDVVHHQAVHYSHTPAKVYKARAVQVASGVFRPHTYPDSRFKDNIVYTMSIRAEVAYYMRIPDTSLTQMARLSSLNPASIAWELTPFSFVVDWFVNIGGFLRDLETTMIYGRYFSGGYSSQSESLDIRCDSSFDPAFQTPGAVETATYWSEVHTRANTRNVLGVMPNVPLPKFEPRLGSGRLLNAAALLTTLLRH